MARLIIRAQCITGARAPHSRASCGQTRLDQGAPLTHNLSFALAHPDTTWRQVPGERYPGCGGGLARGGFDSLVLRALDVLGAVRLCPTSYPEKCMDAFKA